MDSDGTFAYEGGGYSFSVGDNINQFGRFDPVANTWMPLAPVPDLNNGEASAVYAPNVNKLFVFGGEEVTFAQVVNTTRIYDIATNTWSTGAPMPDVRAFMASGYFNGKIYLVGGYNSGSVDPSFGQVWEYDPVTNTFDTSRTDMPATLGGPGFGIVNGHMYVAGCARQAVRHGALGRRPPRRPPVAGHDQAGVRITGQQGPPGCPSRIRRRPVAGGGGGICEDTPARAARSAPADTMVAEPAVA